MCKLLSRYLVAPFFLNTSQSSPYRAHIRNKLEEVNVPNSRRICACHVSTFTDLSLLWGHLPPEPLNMSAEAFLWELKWQKRCTFSVVQWNGFTLNCIVCMVVRICSSDFFWIPHNFFRFANVSLIIYTMVLSVLMQSLRSYKLYDMTIMQFGSCGSYKHYNNLI